MAAHSFTRPDRTSSTSGALPSPHAPISRPLWRLMMSSYGQRIARRLWRMRGKPRLNPLFVEWLMGWPEGHALSRCSATGFTRWQRDMRSALSALPLASGPWIWEPPSGEAPEQLGLFA